MREIGRTLGVRYALTGSARKAGTLLRITAQLVDTTTDEQLWAEKYTGTMDDVFDVQERVSRAIVSALARDALGIRGRAARRAADQERAGVRAVSESAGAGPAIRRLDGPGERAAGAGDRDRGPVAAACGRCARICGSRNCAPA